MEDNHMKLYWKFNKLWKILFLFFLMIVVVTTYFLLYYDSYTSCTSNIIEATDATEPISKGEVLSQRFHCEYNGLKAVKIYFSTNGRKNRNKLHISLLEDSTELSKWEINCIQLADRSYYTLLLDKPLKESKDKNYNIMIESDALDGTGVSIYKNTEGTYDGLQYNGYDLENQSLCYQLQYKNQLKRDSFSFIARFIVICSLIIIIWLALQAVSVKPEIQFLVIWCMLSFLYVKSLTLFSVPDEPAHFFRAYEISLGDFIADYNEKIHGGGYQLPFDVDLSLLSSSWLSFENNKTMQLSDNWVFRDFSNTAVYAPVSYLPQVTGILIARCMTGNIAQIAYAGRFMNWIFITVILFTAIRLIPYGKKVLMLIALIPMNIHEAVSLAPDGMVVAVSALMAAFVMYLSEKQREKLSLQQIGHLYLLAVIISMYKIVYIPFCLIYLLIPAERFIRGVREKTVHACFLIVIVGTLSILWLKTCGSFLIYDGTDAALQKEYIMSHPFTYYITVARTYINSAHDLLFTMIGKSLGKLNIPTSGIFMLCYFLMLIHSFHMGIDKHRIKQMIVFGLVIFTTVLLISRSLYLQWTSLYSDVIVGLQGRYYLPLLLPAYFLLSGSGSQYGNNDLLSVYWG